MFAVTAKTGLVFCVVLSVLGAVQSQSVTDMLMVLTTAGVVPGTNLIIPAEAVLIFVALALMVITALLFRSYVIYHSSLDRFLSEYEEAYQEDPPFTALVPGLGRLTMAGQVAMAAVSEASLRLYFWFKYFGRPVTAQTITVREGFVITIVRFDRWAADRMNLQENLLLVGTMLREWADKARTYIIKLTML